MLLQACQVASDGILDIGQRLFPSLAFGDAPGQCRAFHCVIPVFVLLDDRSILHAVMPTVASTITSSFNDLIMLARSDECLLISDLGICDRIRFVSLGSKHLRRAFGVNDNTGGVGVWTWPIPRAAVSHPQPAPIASRRSTPRLPARLRKS